VRCGSEASEAGRLTHRRRADDEPRPEKHHHEPFERKQREDKLDDDGQAPDPSLLPAQARVLPDRPRAAAVVGFEEIDDIRAAAGHCAANLNDASRAALSFARGSYRQFLRKR
jgi:hypothetical protein